MTPTLTEFGSLPATEEVIERADGRHLRERSRRTRDLSAGPRRAVHPLRRGAHPPTAGHHRGAVPGAGRGRRACQAHRDQRPVRSRSGSRPGDRSGAPDQRAESRTGNASPWPSPTGPPGLPAGGTRTSSPSTTATRGALARSTMAAARAIGATAAGMYGRALTQQVVVNSRGVRRADLATEASGALTVAAGDGSARWVDFGRSADRLDVAGSAARAWTRRSVAGAATELTPGDYRVVLGPEATGELLQFLPALGFAGSLAADGLGLVANALASPWPRSASPCSTTPAPMSACRSAATSRASLGRPCRCWPSGVVGSAVTDLATAARLGTASNGHAHIAREEMPSPVAANIVMAAGRIHRGRPDRRGRGRRVPATLLVHPAGRPDHRDDHRCHQGRLLPDPRRPPRGAHRRHALHPVRPGLPGDASTGSATRWSRSR